jgi:hypothetical protein
MEPVIPMADEDLQDWYEHGLGSSDESTSQDQSTGQDTSKSK